MALPAHSAGTAVPEHCDDEKAKAEFQKLTAIGMALRDVPYPEVSLTSAFERNVAQALHDLKEVMRVFDQKLVHLDQRMQSLSASSVSQVAHQPSAARPPAVKCSEVQRTSALGSVHLDNVAPSLGFSPGTYVSADGHHIGSHASDTAHAHTGIDLLELWRSMERCNAEQAQLQEEVQRLKAELSKQPRHEPHFGHAPRHEPHHGHDHGHEPHHGHVTHHGHEQPRHEARQIFDMCDVDRSGAIDKNELPRALQQIGLDAKAMGMNPAEWGAWAAKIVQRYDADGNGQLEFEEFSKLIRELSGQQVLSSHHDETPAPKPLVTRPVAAWKPRERRLEPGEHLELESNESVPEAEDHASHVVATSPAAWSIPEPKLCMIESHDPFPKREYTWPIPSNCLDTKAEPAVVPSVLVETVRDDETVRDE